MSTRISSSSGGHVWRGCISALWASKSGWRRIDVIEQGYPARPQVIHPPCASAITVVSAPAGSAGSSRSASRRPRRSRKERRIRSTAAVASQRRPAPERLAGSDRAHLVPGHQEAAARLAVSGSPHQQRPVRRRKARREQHARLPRCWDWRSQRVPADGDHLERVEHHVHPVGPCKGDRGSETEQRGYFIGGLHPGAVANHYVKVYVR